MDEVEVDENEGAPAVLGGFPNKLADVPNVGLPPKILPPIDMLVAGLPKSDFVC